MRVRLGIHLGAARRTLLTNNYNTARGRRRASHGRAEAALTDLYGLRTSRAVAAPLSPNMKSEQFDLGGEQA